MPKITFADIIQRFGISAEHYKYWPSPGLRVDDGGIWHDELTGYEASSLSETELSIIREAQRAAILDDYDDISPVLEFPCELCELVEFFDKAKILTEFNYEFDNSRGNSILDWHEEEYGRLYNVSIQNVSPGKKTLKKNTESDLILNTLRELNYDPKALVAGSGSVSGAKKAVWNAVHSEFKSRDAFDSRWKAMKDQGDLVDAKQSG